MFIVANFPLVSEYRESLIARADFINRMDLLTGDGGYVRRVVSHSGCYRLDLCKFT